MTFLGAPGWAYSRGVPALYLLVSFSLALIPWWWLGTRVARLGRHYGFLTQGDYFFLYCSLMSFVFYLHLIPMVL